MRSELLPAREARRPSWGRLAGVAVLLAIAVVPVADEVSWRLGILTWGLWAAPGGPPVWLEVMVVAVVVAAPGVLAGLVVGRVAGLRRWWLVLAAVLSAVGAVATFVLSATFGGDAVARFDLGWAVPGMVAGSLLAVLLADRLGHGAAVHDGEPTAVRPRPTRSRQGRLIAGVCSGWARARGYDVTQVRIVAVAVVVLTLIGLSILTPVPLVLYAIAWLTWPLDDPPQPPEEPTAA